MKIAQAYIDNINLTSYFTNYIDGSFIESISDYQFKVQASETSQVELALLKSEVICSLVDDDEIIDFSNVLSVRKMLRYKEIDARTDAIFGEGLSYNGSVFSMSLEAQTNWGDIMIGVLAGIEKFPRTVSLKDRSKEYTFNTLSDFMGFAASYKTFKQIIDQGREIRLQVSAATTIEELESIADNR